MPRDNMPKPDLSPWKGMLESSATLEGKMKEVLEAEITIPFSAEKALADRDSLVYALRNQAKYWDSRTSPKVKQHQKELAPYPEQQCVVWVMEEACPGLLKVAAERSVCQETRSVALDAYARLFRLARDSLAMEPLRASEQARLRRQAYEALLHPEEPFHRRLLLFGCMAMDCCQDKPSGDMLPLYVAALRKLRLTSDRALRLTWATAGRVMFDAAKSDSQLVLEEGVARELVLYLQCLDSKGVKLSALLPDLSVEALYRCLSEGGSELVFGPLRLALDRLNSDAVGPSAGGGLDEVAESAWALESVLGEEGLGRAERSQRARRLRDWGLEALLPLLHRLRDDHAELSDGVASLLLHYHDAIDDPFFFSNLPSFIRFF